MKRAFMMGVSATFFVLSECALAQTQISMTTGIANSLQSIYREPKFEFYPEIHISKNVLNSPDGKPALKAGVYSAYLAENGNKRAACIDCAIYSYRSVLTGLRLTASPHDLPIPLNFFGGLSMRFINADVLTISGWGPPETDFHDEILSLDWGVSVQFQITNKHGAGFGFQQYRPLLWKSGYYRAQNALGLIFSYSP